MGNVLDRIATAEHLGPSEPLVPLPPELAEYEDAENPEVRGPWQIESIGSADWALLRIAECEAEAKEIDRQANAAIDRINARRAAVKAKAARGVAYFTFKLTEWAAKNRTSIVRGKKKSRDFIHGRIQFRKAGGRLVVKDEKALHAWIVAQPVELGLARIEVKPDKRAIDEWYARAMAAADAALARGEAVDVVSPPPGMTWEVESEDIRIDASAPETALTKE